MNGVYVNIVTVQQRVLNISGLRADLQPIRADARLERGRGKNKIHVQGELTAQKFS